MLDPQQAKAQSERAILALGGDVSTTLPAIPTSELRLRTSVDVARRALILNALFAMSSGVNPRVARRWIGIHGVMGTVVPSEVAWVGGGFSVAEHGLQRLGGDGEALMAAAWAGSLIDFLDPVQSVPQGVLGLFPDLN